MPDSGRNIFYLGLIFLASFCMVLFVVFDQGLLHAKKPTEPASSNLAIDGQRISNASPIVLRRRRNSDSTSEPQPNQPNNYGNVSSVNKPFPPQNNAELMAALQSRNSRNPTNLAHPNTSPPHQPSAFPHPSPYNMPAHYAPAQAQFDPLAPSQQGYDPMAPAYMSATYTRSATVQASLPNYPYTNSGSAAQRGVTMASSQETVAPPAETPQSSTDAPFNSPPPTEPMPPPTAPAAAAPAPPAPAPASPGTTAAGTSKDTDGERKKKEASASQSEKSEDNKPPEAIGVPPPRPQPEFLRDTSVLLDPGQYQFESGIAYTSNITDTVIGQLRDDQLLVANLRTTSRNLQIPMEFRVGLTDDMQGSLSLPIGFANQAISVGNTKDAEDRWGIGDLSAGLTRVLREGKNGSPNILGNLAFSAPTADTSFPAAQQVPGANLGSGFWTVSTGITAVQNIDPIAVYYGLSYSNTFETALPNGIDLDPGNIFSYRLGVGYAVNSRIALSAAFEGNYIGELKLNDTWISGSAREPFTIRLAATIQSNKSANTPKLRRRKSTEPFIRFGLSESSPDVSFGLRWTY